MMLVFGGVDLMAGDMALLSCFFESLHLAMHE